MTARRAQQLAAEGYEHVATIPVGLPHFVWVTDIEVEYDRGLRRVEETILRLVSAGVTDVGEVAALMGLGGERMITNAVVGLLGQNALAPAVLGLRLTPVGERMLVQAAARARSNHQEKLRHDPYRDELRWSFEEPEYNTERELAGAGLRALPTPPQLRPVDVEARHAEVQRLLDREGLPFDGPGAQKDGRRREVLRVRPLRTYVAYREAELHLWLHRQRGEWEWRLLRGGGEEREASERLAELESEGHTIIPLDDLELPTLSRPGEAIHEAVESVATKARSAPQEPQEHREAIRDVIGEAREHLIVVSPWLRTSGVDAELLFWLNAALDKNKSLKIVVAYGIDRQNGRRRDPTLPDQESAIRRLREAGGRSRDRLRVVEVGTTHEKLVIGDERCAIVTGSTCLPFDPRPGWGVRREERWRITDASAVAQLRAKIVAVLNTAAPQR